MQDLHVPRALLRWAPVQPMAMWSRRQWKVAGWSYLAALLIMGVAGETLPGASAGRVVPIQWWNYVTLVLSPPRFDRGDLRPGRPVQAGPAARKGGGGRGRCRRHGGDGVPGVQSDSDSCLRGGRRTVVPRAISRRDRAGLGRVPCPDAGAPSSRGPDLPARATAGRPGPWSRQSTPVMPPRVTRRSGTPFEVASPGKADPLPGCGA